MAKREQSWHEKRARELFEDLVEGNIYLNETAVNGQYRMNAACWQDLIDHLSRAAEYQKALRHRFDFKETNKE
jgi:hypothetical protein